MRVSLACSIATKKPVIAVCRLRQRNAGADLQIFTTRSSLLKTSIFLPRRRSFPWSARSTFEPWAPRRHKAWSFCPLLLGIQRCEPDLEPPLPPNVSPLQSITSSARNSRDIGSSIPIVLAVLLFTIICILVVCSTGMSPGFAPRSNLIHENCSATEHLGKVDSIGDQPTGCGKLQRSC